jgi:hypothetical protein
VAACADAQEIRCLQKAAHGITAVYVTRDQEEAMAISEWSAVMHQGVIVQVDRRGCSAIGWCLNSQPSSSVEPISRAGASSSSMAGGSRWRWKRAPPIGGRPGLTVYYLGVPDTTPEVTIEAALETYLARPRSPGR